jgi:hypothetical protein
VGGPAQVWDYSSINDAEAGEDSNVVSVSPQEETPVGKGVHLKVCELSFGGNINASA